MDVAISCDTMPKMSRDHSSRVLKPKMYEIFGTFCLFENFYFTYFFISIVKVFKAFGDFKHVM